MERRALLFGDRIVAARVGVARTSFERAVGYLFRTYIAEDEALFFEHCNALHTVGVFTSLDVVAVDDDLVVTEVRACVAPFSPAVIVAGVSVFELAPGHALACELRPGCALRFA